MSTELVNTPSNGTAAPDSQPGNTNSEKSSGKTFTQDEVESLIEKKLRGQGKELQKLRDALLASEKEKEEKSRKELEEQGKFKEINQKLTAELDELRTWKKNKDEAESKELEEINASNEERLKKLPDALKRLIHPELSPKAKAKQLTEVEALVREKEIKIHGGAGGWQKPQEPADIVAMANKKGEEWIRGGKKK